MRLLLLSAGLIGLAAGLSGCVEGAYGPEPITLSRVDPEDAAQRALIGGMLGATLGTGLGVSFALNPAMGGVIGIERGAAMGAAAGVITAQPLPAYAPIAVPQEAVIPGFFDTWPPGFRPPPIAEQTPPPLPG